MQFAVRWNIVAKYRVLRYINQSGIQLFILTEIARFGKRWEVDPKVAGSTLLCATIFLEIKFTHGHMSLQLETNNQNDCSVKNQIEYTGLRQGFHLYIISRLFKSSRSSFKLTVKGVSFYICSRWTVMYCFTTIYRWNIFPCIGDIRYFLCTWNEIRGIQFLSCLSVCDSVAKNPLTVSITFEVFTCTFLVIRPFRSCQKFWPSDLYRDLWPTYLKL